MFSRLQHALKTADGRRVLLNAHMNNEINLWLHFTCYQYERTTHLREITPHPPTWTGVMDAPLKGIGGVCLSPSEKWFVWRPPIWETMSQHLLTEDKPSGDLTTNDLEIAAYIAHLHILCPLTEPMNHI